MYKLIVILTEWLIISRKLRAITNGRQTVDELRQLYNIAISEPKHRRFQMTWITQKMLMTSP